MLEIKNQYKLVAESFVVSKNGLNEHWVVDDLDEKLGVYDILVLRKLGAFDTIFRIIRISKEKNELGMYSVQIIQEGIVIDKDQIRLSNIQTASDLYQFVFRCVEAHPAGGLLREAVINLSRVHIAGTIGNPSIKTYKLNNISNGVTHFVNKNDLREPKLLIYKILRLIEGC